MRGRIEASGPSELIGDTPLLKLKGQAWGLDSVDIYAKAEWFNPGGSVKDRPVLWMIRDAVGRGRLRQGMTLLDATSGNTGIAIAMLGTAMGFKTKLVMPANASRERQAILRSYGAELVLTDPLGGTDVAQRVAEKIHRSDTTGTFLLDQYNNPANWKAHYEGTAVEILQQTGGEITHFVAGIGTGGTLVGTGRRLKEHDPSIRVVGVQPASPLHGIEGLKHMESSRRPGIYDSTVQDMEVMVETEEAQRHAKLLAKKEGLLVGTSSGAALVACLSLAREIPDGRIVTIFPDKGERYLSERYWEEV